MSLEDMANDGEQYDDEFIREIARYDREVAHPEIYEDLKDE